MKNELRIPALCAVMMSHIKLLLGLAKLFSFLTAQLKAIQIFAAMKRSDAELYMQYINVMYFLKLAAEPFCFL